MRVLGLSGSLRGGSYNTMLVREAAALLPDGVFLELWHGLKAIPPFDEDDEHERPAAVQALFDAIADADVVLVATPEYNRSIPGALKNAIDWASRPYGQNSFTRKPSAVIGTSPGKIGTAVGQQHLRSILAFCNSPLMNAIEAYIQFEPGLITDEGEITVESTRDFLRDYMAEFHGFITRVYTALPRGGA